MAPSWKFWKKRRHVVGVLAFLGFFTSYILRVNLSVAIVAMVQAEVQKVDENGNIYYVSERILLISKKLFLTFVTFSMMKWN